MLKFIAINAALLGAGYLTLSSAVWWERRRGLARAQAGTLGRQRAPVLPMARPGQAQASRLSAGQRPPKRCLQVDQTPPLPMDWARPIRGATDQARPRKYPFQPYPVGHIVWTKPQPAPRPVWRRWLPWLLLGLLLAGWSDWASL